MPTDPQSAIDQLARRLRALKSEPASLPVLYIGEYASRTKSGYSWHDEIERRVVEELGGLTPQQVNALPPAERSAQFNRLWAENDKHIRRFYMRTVMQELSQPSEGFLALAKLLSEGYFRLVLTANPNALIEEALTAVGVRTMDYHRAINQLDQLPRIRQLLNDYTRKFVIFKLIGDFDLMDLDATDITPRQIRTLMEKTRDTLEPFVSLPLVIAGYGAFDDFVLSYFPSTGDNLGNVTYIGTEGLSSVEGLFSPRRVIPITGSDITFDGFSLRLAQTLLGIPGTIAPPTPEPLLPPAPTPPQQPIATPPLQQPHTGGHTQINTPLVVFEDDDEPLPPPQAAPEPQVVRQAPAPAPAPVAPFFSANPPSVSSVEPMAPVEPIPTPAPAHVEAPVRPPTPPRPARHALLEELTITVFNVDVDSQKGISFRLSGGRIFKSDERLIWSTLNIDRENEDMRRLGDELLSSYQTRDVQQHHQWREQAKQKGVALFRSLEAAHPELGKQLAAAMQDFGRDQLTLCFNGPLPHLSIPYEILYNRDTPLAVSYPMCRHVTGVNVRSRKFDDIVNDMKTNKKELRVLLIASGADTDLKVDEELEDVANIITQRAREQNFKVSIKRLPSDKATLENVRAELSHCKYHLIHFAGHGYFNAGDGEKSGIVLRTGGGLFSRTGTSVLTAHEISMLLRERDTQTQLVYLSACVGAAGASSEQLRGRDSLGMLDAIVRAEIPYVFGFRWYVSDHGGRSFAHQFYMNLFDGFFNPEQSVMEARRYLYTNNPMDETWASSILVAQHVRDN